MIRLGKMRYFDKNIELTRFTGGQYDVTGRYITGAPATVLITGNIQPFIRQGGDTLRLPDGLSESDAKTLWTQDEVRTVDQFGDLEADTVEIDGTPFVAYRILNYTHTQMQLYHREVLLIRRDRPEVT